MSLGPLPRFALFAGLLAAAAPLASEAQAQSRPNSTRLSCAQAAGLVAARGAVVMTTGPNTYDRYVRDRRFCTPIETTRPAWVATRDSRQCMVGYTCEDVERDRFLPF